MPKILKNSQKNTFWGSLKSFKVIGVNTPGKPVTSAWYDEQQVCAYLQPRFHDKQVNSSKIITFAGSTPLWRSSMKSFQCWNVRCMQNCEKFTKNPFLGVQGRPCSSMLINLKSLSPVPVMISSMSVPICNRFHTAQANNGKITSFRIVPLFEALITPTSTKFCHEKLETLRQLMVKTAWSYSLHRFDTDHECDRQTDRQTDGRLDDG